eukprot:1026318-Rhodomonas_salina.3
MVAGLPAPPRPRSVLPSIPPDPGVVLRPMPPYPAPGTRFRTMIHHTPIAVLAFLGPPKYPRLLPVLTSIAQQPHFGG